MLWRFYGMLRNIRFGGELSSNGRHGRDNGQHGSGEGPAFRQGGGHGVSGALHGHNRDPNEKNGASCYK